MKSGKALVVGAGIVGLTTAISLLESDWEKVIIIAELVSPETTSDGAAAFWEPFLSMPAERVLKWSKYSWNKYMQIIREENSLASGVHLIDGFEFGLEDPSTFEPPEWMKLLEHRSATPSEIPEGYTRGIYFVSCMIEMQRFMPWLNIKFRELGGTIEIRKLYHLDELLNHNLNPDVIVNCTGLGSFDLLPDRDIFPIRGQVVKVDAPQVKNFYMASSVARSSTFPEASSSPMFETSTATYDTQKESRDLVYILPRDDCVIIGGTVEPNNWNIIPDPRKTKEILNHADKLFPGISRARIIGEWVGLRPGRFEIRLEMEPMKQPSGVTLVHNYGHGGGGVTLCWGCAEEIVQLLKPRLMTLKRSQKLS